MVDDFVVEEAVQNGHVWQLFGKWQGHAAVAKINVPVFPWLDSGSAFFGGKGIVTPFRPLIVHEAMAWQKLDPDRVLTSGVGQDGLWLVLRKQPGEAPTNAIDGDRLLVGLLESTARLHANDVLHRDIRPANVLVHGDQVQLIDLDIARVEGLGPAGKVGSSTTRAPECGAGEADGRADLYAVGRTVQMIKGDDLSASAKRMVAGLTAESPADRPPSAQAALEDFDLRGSPVANLSDPHPWARAWWGGASLVQGIGISDIWNLVQNVDKANVGVPGLAGIASRVLRTAVQRGGQSWLVLSTLCRFMYEKGGNELHLVQSEEARLRASMPWHSVDGALQTLNDKQASADLRTQAWCAANLPMWALEQASSDRSSARVAYAAWALGDDAKVDKALAAVRGDNDLAIAVSASRLIRVALEETPAEIAEKALPDAQSEAIRTLLYKQKRAEAVGLAASFAGLQRTRAELTIAIEAGDIVAARKAAGTLVDEGLWDKAVAALMVEDESAPEPLREQASQILEQLFAIPDPSQNERNAEVFEALGADPSDPQNWARVMNLLVSESSWADAGELVGMADATWGPTPWQILIGGLIGAQEWAVAQQILTEAIARFADDPVIGMLEIAVAAGQNDVDRVKLLSSERILEKPDDPFTWLIRGLVAEDAAERNRAFESALALGAEPSQVEMFRLLGAQSRGAAVEA